MNCQKCKDLIEPGEERQHLGRTLCEDCYMDMLSPPRTCDPWAVHTAKSCIEQTGPGMNQLTELQRSILELLEKSGGGEPGWLADQLGLKATDLERELAALRHMEKIRGELREGRRVVMIW
jgi:hypothetical protein